MADAFDATLIASTPVRIDSIAAIAVFRLFLAASGTILLVYRMQPEPGSPLKLLDVIKQFSKLPIDQMIPIPDLNLLLVRSDSTLHMYDLGSLAFIGTLSKTKSCLQVSIQPETSGQRFIACTFKGRLVLYQYVNGTFSESKSFNLTGSSLTWLNDKILIAGLPSGQFAVINVENGTCETRGKFGCEKVVKCTENSFLATSSTNLSLITLPNQVQPMVDWTKLPDEIAYLEPYCVGRSGGNLEVKMTPGGETSQIPEVGEAKFLFMDNTSLYTCGNGITIWRLAPVSFLQRLNRLTESQRFEDALRLLETSPMDEQEASKEKEVISRRFAMHLFNRGSYDRAFELFDSVGMSLSNILSLYFVDPEPRFVDKRKAYAALIHDLTTRRTQLRQEKIPNAEMAETIDTALLEAYLRGNPGLVGPLLRVSNHCNLEKSEELLKQFHQEKSLLELYFGRGLHEQALDYLYSCSRDENSSLYGIQPTIAYLARLPLDQLPLTLSRSTWVLQADPMEGLNIFTREGSWDTVESQRKIAQHLRALSPPLCTAYLEYVLDQGSENVEFHDRLLLDYAEQIAAERMANNKTPGDSRQRFQALLECAPSYHAEEILSALPPGGLFEERIILYSRLGRHEKALDLIVNVLQDKKMAEAYCIKHYDTKKNRNIFLLLLAHYGSDDVEATLQLLNKYGNYLEVSKALKFIPDNVDLNEISSFLDKGIQSTSELQSTNSIVRHLAYSDKLNTNLDLIELLKKRITITYDRTCQSCFKRLGTALFVEANRGSLYHYSCWSSNKI